MTNFRKATPKDLDFICNYYRYVCTNTPDMELYGRWIYDRHPTTALIKSYVESGDMYLLESGNTIKAASALTMSQGNDYHSISWSHNFQDDEVAVVHILCSNPDFQHQGYAEKLMHELIQTAKLQGKRAVRLDALSCNTTAHKLYEKLGFLYYGKQILPTANAGIIDFFYYELLLSSKNII